MEQLHGFVHREAGHPGLDVRDSWRHRGVEAVQIECDIDRAPGQHLPRLGDDVRCPARAVLRHGHDIVSVIIGRLQPVERPRVATEADLHRSRRVDQPLVGRIGTPVRGAFLGAEEVIDGGEDVGMGVKMEEADLLAAGEPAAAKPLDDAAGNRMVTTDRHRPRAAGINVPIEIRDALDAVLIVIGPRKRHVTDIDDFRRLPRVQLEAAMRAALKGRDVAYGAGPEMLVALRGAVACRMGDADKRHIGTVGSFMGGAEQRRHTPPVKVLHHAAVVLVSHCPALRDCLA